LPPTVNPLDRSVRPRPERIGHRGVPREKLENTLPSFTLALERGADAVELDVHVTDDGEVVVHHDYTVQNHRIASTRWDDLGRFDLGGGCAIPRLADVLDAIGNRATAYIELKGVHIETAVIAVARTHGQRYALHSFDHDAIDRVRRAAPDIARGVLFDRETPRAADQMKAVVSRVQPRDVWPHWSLVDAEFMRIAHALGVRVIPWTVNSSETARELTSLGVDGICSDDVRLLVNL
jgi:glycerophosphoryl diester phosphodiesterase